MELDWETANSLKQIVLTCQPFEPCKRLSSHTAHEAESRCSTVRNIGCYVNSLWRIQRVNWPLCPNVSFSPCERDYVIVFTSHKLISFFVERTVSLDKESFTHVALHPLEKVPPFTCKNRIGHASGDKMRFPSYIDITCCIRALSSSLVDSWIWDISRIICEIQDSTGVKQVVNASTKVCCNVLTARVGNPFIPGWDSLSCGSDKTRAATCPLHTLPYCIEKIDTV